MNESVRHVHGIAPLIVVPLVVVALTTACGNGGGSADSATTPRTTPSAAQASPDDLEVWQRDLQAVGCYEGAIDGDLGPQTKAAITAFQRAKGLEVDGRLGPQTEDALSVAVDAGGRVCGGSTATASLRSPSYDKTFTLGTCSLNADASNVSLRGSADGFKLVVDASSGTGNLGVSGGSEEDGITLDGTVSKVIIGNDRSFNVSGTFKGPNGGGESFALTGSCPE